MPLESRKSASAGKAAALSREIDMNNVNGNAGAERNAAPLDRSALITEGLRSYLLRNDRERTLEWLDGVASAMPELTSRWQITSFLPNQRSRFGLVLQANSRRHGDVIMKFIPTYVHRYERELEALRLLPPQLHMPPDRCRRGLQLHAAGKDHAGAVRLL